MTPENAMRQAPLTVAEYLQHVRRDIDNEFGEGYAKAHPELVAKLVECCVKDYSATLMYDSLEGMLTYIWSEKEKNSSVKIDF
jgi:L-rhamnose mutarotase